MVMMMMMINIYFHYNGVLTTEVMSLANVAIHNNSVQMSYIPKGQSRIRTPHYPKTKNKKSDLGPNGPDNKRPFPKNGVGLPPNSLDSSRSLATHS